MKLPILILALASIVGLASAALAQNVVPLTALQVAPAELSAAQVLEKSRRTYAGFTTYKGICSVVSDALFAVGDAEPTQDIFSASAQIEFERGERLSVQGVDMVGSPFKALWTPGETWLESMPHKGEGIGPGAEDKTEREIIKDEPDSSAQNSLLASMSGFTGGTGSTIPNALMPDRFDLGNPFSSLGTAKLLPARNLGIVPCYVIEQTVPTLNSVTTYWIEQKTFLLRRMTEEVGEQRYDNVPGVDDENAPITRLAYSLDQFVFATTEAK